MKITITGFGCKGMFFLCVIALAAVVGLSLGDCSAEPASGDPALSGNITINPAGPVTAGTQLSALYIGSETGLSLRYQWKKGGTNVGRNSPFYTPPEAGSYTVTVSAPGYQSKTSAAVTVTDNTLQTLSGTITINPAGPVTAGTSLSALYIGSETGLRYR